MKSIIRWAIANAPAMNTIMIGALVVGLLSMSTLRRELFPEFELEIVLVSVPYPGASPEEAEEGICQKIEEAVRAVEGIKKITSVAQEGAGHVVFELRADVEDVQKTLNEIRSEVDRIPSFPLLAEDPEVKQITFRTPAISIGLVGPPIEDSNDELRIREIAEQIRDDLLQLSTVSEASVLGGKSYQIDVEISEDTLREYGLSLKDVAQIIRRENVEVPGGEIKTEAQTVLLRGKNKRLRGEEIARIPLVTSNDGVVLTVDDLGEVRDEFEDKVSENQINGRDGLVIQVSRTSSEDLLAMVDDVREYTRSDKMKRLLNGNYEVVVFQDRSVDVRDRLELLAENGMQGLILVFLVLAIFLDLRLAFWVALGIPVSVLGACAVLLYSGQTLNMLSMFAFLMAMGILVDDAIVIGENIFTHRQMGKPYLKAAIDGAYEVLPSVIASVSTTIIAFVPLMFVAGIMGKFIAVMPLAMIAMLVISLLESTFILPVHLSHGDSLLFKFIRVVFYPFRFIATCFAWVNRRADKRLDSHINGFYRSALSWSVDNPAIVICGAIALLMISAGMVAGGITPWNTFPKLDANEIFARVVYPEGTPATVTARATQRLEDSLMAFNDAHSVDGKPFVNVRHRAVGDVNSPGALGPDQRISGGHVGVVSVELIESSRRDMDSADILRGWQEYAGEFPGAENVTFDTPDFGPGGKAVEFKLLAERRYMPQLEQAVEEIKTVLKGYPGTRDVSDDSRPGKWEFQVTIKDDAKPLGINLSDVSETIRASFYGEEVQRLQRGRHEVKLMVRYPREDRRSIANLNEIRVRGADGLERPLLEVADIAVNRSAAEINRVDQKRSITVSSDVDPAEGDKTQIRRQLQSEDIPKILEKYPMLSVRWEGEAEQTSESVNSLLIGLLIAMVAMFVLLTIEFRSYFQPFLIMSIIPFGMIGAVWGHAIMGLPLTLFSLFGLVALTGVVVNDSIVLIDFINHRVRDGMPLRDAVIEAGVRRFRPVLLTSCTTIAGLFPILIETSFQAQILVPMATSLCFGLLVATGLVLVLAPTFYMVYGSLMLRSGHKLSEAEDDETVEASLAEPPHAPLVVTPPAQMETERESVGTAGMH